MKAISTKYHGASNVRGSRIIASDGDGNRVSIAYPHELSGADVHAEAALALCRKIAQIHMGTMEADGLERCVDCRCDEGRLCILLCGR